MHARLLVFGLVWAFAYSKTIDQIISDAAKNGINTLNEGEILVDMDMIYEKEEWEQLISNATTRKGINGNRWRWSNNEVPYVIDNIFSRSQKTLIVEGMREWERYTCLKFIPRSGHYNYVYVQDNGSGCNSYVGMRGGRQNINLARGGCLWHRTIVHEFGHAIGFQHEHQRPDRDDMVTIWLDNVSQNNRYNFNRFSSSSIDNQGVAYDYMSVMHYGQTAFSMNGRNTIVTHDTYYQRKIGTSPGLSFNDIQLANRLYDCGKACTNVDCGPNGYLDKDCNCLCNNHDWVNRLCECGAEGCGEGGDGGDGGDGGVEIDCDNFNERCVEWANRGECSINPMYMLYWCPKACKICGDDQDCRDYNSDCPRWRTEGYCNDPEYADYMSRHCRGSCSFC